MEQDQAKFNVLLGNLLSTDNDVRSQAESVLETIDAQQKLPLLITSFSDPSNSVEVRTMASILLRRLVKNDFEKFYPALAPDHQEQLKQGLLNLVRTEQNDVLNKRACDCVTELARNLMDDESNNLWPEFLQFMFECASSPDARLREAAMYIFTNFPGIFGNQQQRYLETARQMLLAGINAAELRVKIQAAKAITQFIIFADGDLATARMFSDCVPVMLQMLVSMLESGDDPVVLKCFVDIAETCPKFLRTHVDALFDICVKTVSTADIEEQWRHLAIEVIVSVSESAAPMVRKLASKHLAALIPQLLKMMTEIDDEEDWATSDELLDEDNESDPIVAESSLDRLACAIGGKLVLPLVISNVQNMLSQQEWKVRHAALMAISAVGEGCHKQMEALLNQIVEGVIKFLHDPHPRVRYAACNALGQMATDFSPIFEKKFHESVLPGLCSLLEDHANPRVQAHAGAALVNFFEECPKSILIPYIPSIVPNLQAVLNAKMKELAEKGTKLVLEQVVVTTAALADRAEEKFQAYYDCFMPGLKYIIEHTTNVKELEALRGKTIECVSLIGLAVGAEKFTADAGSIMELLLQAQTGGITLADDSPQWSYMISAWARICRILGKKFEVYLPHVMEPIMKAASFKPEVAIMDNDDLEEVEDDDDWQIVDLGEQRNFGIRTTGLEEKANACQMLVCYARELKESFVNYAEPVAHLMVPMLKFYFHDGVRIAAAQILPCLLECARIRGPQYMAEMWRYMVPELLSAIDGEPDKEVLGEMLTSLAESIGVIKEQALNEEHMTTVVGILNRLMNEHFERASERQAKRVDEDYDDQVEEELLNEDDEDIFLLSKVAEVVRAIFGVYKTAFVPVFQQLMDNVMRLLAPDRPWPDHQWGLCIIDDLLEFGGPEACVAYEKFFLGPLTNALTSSKSAEVRQAAAYGVGMLAQYGGPHFAPVCADAVSVLAQLIERPDSRSVEEITATENCISAVTRIMVYQMPEASDKLIPRWLSWLPVREDLEEVPVIYAYLCTLVEQNNPYVLGANNANLQHIGSIIVDALARETVERDSDVGKRMCAILGSLRDNQVIFNACVASLSPDLQASLQRVLGITSSP